MTSTLPQVYVDGTWLTALTTWADLSVTHRWPGGCWEASWRVPTTKYRRFTQLQARKDARVYYGATPIWQGYLGDPNWDSGEMVAFGSVRRGDEALALASDQLSTLATPDTAIDNAVVRGALDWIRRASISAVPFGVSDNTDQLNNVAPLLDGYTTQAGVGWGVNARREVFAAAAATVPSWYVVPQSGFLGVADEALAARIFGRYVNLSGATSTVSVGAGSPEVKVDLITDYGPMDSARATAIVTGIYNKTQARTGWTNGLTLSADQITNPGGGRGNLALVVAGQMVRLLGLRDERGLGASTDIILGETVWNVADSTIQCNPIGLAARNLSSIIEDAGAVLL